MRKPNAICKVCGRPYYACSSCEKTESYKTIADTIEHYNIYTTAILFSRKGISAKEAYDIIGKYDYSDIPKDSPVMITVNEILNAGKKTEVKPKIEKSTEEKPKVEKVAEEKKEDTQKETTFKKVVNKKNIKSEK